MRYPLVQRGLIALVQVLAMGVWFSASAVVPALARQWHMSVGSAAWLTTPARAGFVAGAFLAGAYPVGMKLTSALTSLHRTIGPNEPVITITGRTTA